MKSVDYIAVMLFGWTCAIASAGMMVTLGLPWSFALAHTLSACVVGSVISMFLLAGTDFAIKRWHLPNTRATIAKAAPEERGG